MFLRRLKKSLWPLILLLGLLLRIVVYFQNRSLFLDEANLARNIAELSWEACFAPLHYQQYAPPLFLLLEKINWIIFGPSELSLRFWPLIMGCLALVGIYFLLRKIAGTGWLSLFVFYLFAFSQVYIRYSTELKQYSTDMAVTTALIWAAVQYVPNDRKGWLLWAVLGSLSIWLSMPSVFILAGVGCYFLWIRQKERMLSIQSLLLLGTLWLANFGLYYYLILGNDLQKSELLSYHQTYFWPLWPHSAADWQQLYQIIQSLSGTLIGHTFIALLIALPGGIWGLFYLGKKHTELLCLLFTPIVLCLVASGLGRYSLMERLSLFMMPLAGLILAQGLVVLNRQISAWARWILAACCLLILPLRKGLEYFFVPFQYEEMRALLLDLHQEIEATDLIWIDHYAAPAFRWYTAYDPLPVNLVSSPANLVYNSWNGIAFEELKIPAAKSGQIWLVFSHLVSEQNREEMRRDLKSVQDHWGAPHRELHHPGVMLFGWKLEE